MTQAYLRSFILEVNQTNPERPYPVQANRLTQIQASGLYRDLQLALRQESSPLQQTALLRAWQELRELGYETDLDPRE